MFLINIVILKHTKQQSKCWMLLVLNTVKLNSERLNMLKLIKKYRKFLIIISFAYIYVLVALIAPRGFYALTPGEINSTNNVFEIENTNFDNDFNTISVYSWRNITVFQKWLINN